jgi:hypothetical protein
MTISIITLNESADYWHYYIGVNVIPADTKRKRTYENWTQWQNLFISDEMHESRKKNGEYNNGLAIIPGKIWRGPFADKYLIAIDLDNEKAIQEFCKDENGLQELKQQTLVEQTANPEKMHIYFIVDREIPNKASDKVDSFKSEKIKTNEIPALEVKSTSKGIMFVANSPHQKDGYYQIKGTIKPQIFNAQDVKDRISLICDKYGIPYSGFNYNNDSTITSYQIPIEDLWKTETIILKGHNRHLELLRIMESELQKNRGIKPLDMIKQIAQIWNQSHCSPPLNDIEFEKQWKDALEFVEKSIINDTNPSDIDEGNNDDEVDVEDDNDLFSIDNNTADERKSNDTNKNNNNDDDDTKSIPQILMKLALENSTLFKNEFGMPHALVKINNCFDVLSIEGKKFESYLSKIYYDHDNKKKIASAEAIKNAKRILVAKAIFEGQTIQLHLRVAWSNTENKDSIHYDMTDDKRRCIKITKGNGWKVVENQIEVLFRRYGHQSPQIEPSRNYDCKVLDNFIDSLNIKNEKHKLLIKVWIISLLIPDISRVILLPYGPPGSAKSTLLKKIQLLIDPTQLDLLSINDSKTEYIQQIAHHYLCFFDNLSYVPRWLPDEACRTATGAASSKRELYTDDEDVPYKYKRPQGYAGINVIFTQEDVLDRSIKIELDRIEQENNIPDTKIEEGLKQQIPQLLGYILDVVSKALEIKDSVTLKRLPRMADFAEWGEAIARALGYKSLEFLYAYFENVDQQHLEIVESDPFAETISKFIDYDTRSWISSPKVFINYLREYADANNIDSSKFPKALQTISFRLNKIKPTLLEFRD